MNPNALTQNRTQKPDTHTSIPLLSRKLTLKIQFKTLS